LTCQARRRTPSTSSQVSDASRSSETGSRQSRPRRAHRPPSRAGTTTLRPDVPGGSHHSLLGPNACGLQPSAHPSRARRDANDLTRCVHTCQTVTMASKTGTPSTFCVNVTVRMPFDRVTGLEGLATRGLRLPGRDVRRRRDDVPQSRSSHRARPFTPGRSSTRNAARRGCQALESGRFPGPLYLRFGLGRRWLRLPALPRIEVRKRSVAGRLLAHGGNRRRRQTNNRHRERR
jgi:hypothetical protein